MLQSFGATFNHQKRPTVSCGCPVHHQQIYQPTQNGRRTCGVPGYVAYHYCDSFRPQHLKNQIAELEDYISLGQLKISELKAELAQLEK